MPTTKNRSTTTQDGSQPEMTLSEAASIMRDDNATPEERSRAASVMGREGGKHSHDRDAKTSRTKVEQPQQQEEEA
jgi:hypothetical protein